jgi:hypothetical protein
MSVSFSTPYWAKNEFILPFPPHCIFFSWSLFHESMVTDLRHAGRRRRLSSCRVAPGAPPCPVQPTHLTKLMCTPRPRWRPLHSRHMNMP